MTTVSPFAADGGALHEDVPLPAGLTKMIIERGSQLTQNELEQFLGGHPAEREYALQIVRRAIYASARDLQALLQLAPDDDWFAAESNLAASAALLSEVLAYYSRGA